MTATETPDEIREENSATPKSTLLSFNKGGEETTLVTDKQDWEKALPRIRKDLGEALNARNLSFLLGSGCSSFYKNGEELGIPTMQPMAKDFVEQNNTGDEYNRLKNLGLDIAESTYAQNLERLIEMLSCLHFVLNGCSKDRTELITKVDVVMKNVTDYILSRCEKSDFSKSGHLVLSLYQKFYQKLSFRDRSLPQPWVFTTNYDLFNERAMDRLGIPYCNGFSGTIERHFNPGIFRYSLAEQLDITSRKWTAVDNFVYLCKLHGSINWIEKGDSLFPIQELQKPPDKDDSDDKRMMIYPTPAKQNASLGSPYADLFREFQQKIVRDQSVLFTIGYSFGDEHVNNIIFQALTVPNFRLIALLPPDADGIPKKLRELQDPRIWMIGGEGTDPESKAHFFKTFVETFMPQLPGSKVDSAIIHVIEELIAKSNQSEIPEESNAI